LPTESLLIGIDDTDNLSSRGTGYRARRLAGLLQDGGYATVDGVSRHQLLLSPRIPYTSHNSAACLRLSAARMRLSVLTGFCREYLLREAADGSDAGLCVAFAGAAGEALQSFGVRAQREVLSQAHAKALASGCGVYLEGLTGTRDGIIGALAAVGLRRRGQGGRFIWVSGLRERAGQCLRADQLAACTGVHAIRSRDGAIPASHEWVELGPWPRPVLIDGEAILLVEKSNENEHRHSQWRVIDKAAIKRY